MLTSGCQYFRHVLQQEFYENISYQIFVAFLANIMQWIAIVAKLAIGIKCVCSLFFIKSLYIYIYIS